MGIAGQCLKNTGIYSRKLQVNQDIAMIHHGDAFIHQELSGMYREI